MKGRRRADFRRHLQPGIAADAPLPGGGPECAERDFVGDWLVGMCTRVGEEFSLADATADYKKMVDEAGPLTRAAFMAQAYGVAVAPELGRFPASSACRPPGRRPRVQTHPDPVRAHAPPA